MEDHGVPPHAASGAPRFDDGTSAVLYAMFTSFMEVLGNIEKRLDAIEAAVPAGPAVDAVLDDRLTRIENAVRSVRATDAGTLEGAAATAERLGAVEGAVGDLSELLRARAESPTGPPDDEVTVALRTQGDLLDQRTAALAAAIEELRALVQAHVDDTAHSLGRRAGEAGRRLAGDLGLRARPRQPKNF